MVTSSRLVWAIEILFILIYNRQYIANVTEPINLRIELKFDRNLECFLKRLQKFQGESYDIDFIIFSYN